jgi:formin 2
LKIANIHNLLNSGGDASKLGNPEKFSLELEKVPQLEARIKAFVFKLSFDNKKSEIKPDIETLKLASKEVLEAKKLVQLLEANNQKKIQFGDI